MKALTLLVALLLVPFWASLQMVRFIDPRWLYGYLLLISGIAFWLFWQDKRRAEAGTWRTPESTLHLVELLGGWPGAFLAQRAFRHKISKTSYQIAFWAIVVMHELVSADFLCEWKFAKSVIGVVAWVKFEA